MRGWFPFPLVVAVALLCGGRLDAQVSPGPLAKAHRQLEGTLKCTQCHGPGKDAMPARCAACHKDVGWLAARSRGYHGSAAVKAKTCASCHPDHAGLEFQLVKWPEGAADRFDHRRAGWALEGSHRKIECEKCHVAQYRVSPAAALAPGGKSRWTGLEQTCTSCHEDIHRGALGDKCTSCHDAGLWKVTPGFQHDTTAYPLTGQHREVECDKCHADARLPLKRDPRGNPIPVYRPVPAQTCGTCHADVHKGAFGSNCSACHTTKGFSEISATRGFDHGRTEFPLRGRHAAVKCAACHADFTSERGRRPAAETCATCHKTDPHGGTATLAGKPADCGACHGESGFSPGSFPPERHRETRYPLEGKHARVRCADCHRREPAGSSPSRWGTSRVVIRPAFGTCGGCHADQHGGQLAARPDQGECAACHRPDGWAPSGFDRAAHAKTRLPLEGRHADVTCQACHAGVRKGLRPLPNAGRLGSARFALTGLETGCAGCHADPHGGRFEPGGARPVTGGCAACHDAKGFAPAAIDVDRHAAFPFRLTGAHRATPCQACHPESRPRSARPAGATLIAAAQPLVAARYEARSDCVACHADDDPHGTQFAKRKGGGACDACHDDEAFAPAVRFDHDRDAAFKLEGGHRPVPCRECHKPTAGAVGGAARVIYRPLSGKCEDCHASKPRG